MARRGVARRMAWRMAWRGVAHGVARRMAWRVAWLKQPGGTWSTSDPTDSRGRDDGQNGGGQYPAAMAETSTVVRPTVPAAQLGAWRALLESHARVVELLAAELRDTHDLPLTWYDVLLQLHEASDRRLRMQELADRVLLSKSGLTRLVDRMEKAGLVARSACPSDRRGTFAELTPAGRSRLRETAPTHLQGIINHVADLLDDEEAATLEHLLRRLADAADAHR